MRDLSSTRRGTGFHRPLLSNLASHSARYAYISVTQLHARGTRNYSHGATHAQLVRVSYAAVHIRISMVNLLIKDMLTKVVLFKIHID
jgi:hypothetical protein